MRRQYICCERRLVPDNVSNVEFSRGWILAHHPHSNFEVFASMGAAAAWVDSHLHAQVAVDQIVCHQHEAQ